MPILEKLSNTQIRENRLRIKEKIKLSLVNHQNKQKISQIKKNSNKFEIKNETHVKVINRIGLVQKQFIQGSFQDSYILKEKIGQGAHATVYKCIQKSTQKAFAVKITKHSDQQLVESAKFQYKILKSLNHDNIMKAEALYTDRTKMTTYLVCQLCTYSQLGIYLRNRKTNFIQESQATKILKNLLETLQYLHHKGVCHRDLKPQNILYDPDTKKLKVIDFDCAKNKRQGDIKFQMWTKTGSLHYQAPEYFQNTVYNQKVDIWAVGIIAYELITGNLPFKSNYYQRIAKMITQQEIHVKDLNVSNDFKFILKKLLQKDHSKRLSASQCLRLPLMLRVEKNSFTKVVDDFDVELSTCLPDSPRSCSDFFIGRRTQIMTSVRNPQIKSILKFYCFVQ